ncbi:hypothetical protein ONZ45_g14118 [Pleurotus djamor]|nr:hypothetical protein ONZ45_g14118 [Pleurotus djamor]
MPREEPNADHWEPHPTLTNQYKCLVCFDGIYRLGHRIPAHENTDKHNSALRTFNPSPPSSSLPSGAPSSYPPTPFDAFIRDGTQNLVYSLAYPSNEIPAESTPPQPQSLVHWNLSIMSSDENLVNMPEDQMAAVRKVAAQLYEYVNGPMDSDSEAGDDEEWDDEDVPPDDVPEPMGVLMTLKKRTLPAALENGPDDPTSTLKHFHATGTLGKTESYKRFPSLSHQPISHLFLWLLKVNQVDDVPSVKKMVEINAELQKKCGIKTLKYSGAFGHKYYVNSLPDIIAQEMANPKVRPHLSFYPEDSGKKLSEARQAARWLHELPDNQLTPMLRLGAQDYYIHEPAMLRDGNVVMPIRWFTRGSKVHAKCWGMEVVDLGTGTSKWRVVQRHDYEISQDDLMKTFPDLQIDHRYYRLPDFDSFLDLYDPVTKTSTPWTITDPQLGNRWRALSKGHRTYAFPIWLYCDDTSGNVSKKWNEHNSFLFIPAGLPREKQKEYNIHFLSTSNKAPPVEMLEAVVSQLKSSQEDGIWAWDCVHEEPVLIIPMILALLGDNPMQSTDASDESGIPSHPHGAVAREEDNESGVSSSESAAASDAASDSTNGADKSLSGSKKDGKKRSKKVKETLHQMMTRVSSFIKVGEPRSKERTMTALQSQFDQAKLPGSKTRVATMRTETGTKDTYQLHYVEQLFASTKGRHGTDSKAEAIKATLETFPNNTMSPVWQLDGLDPHQDTPVEILHVVLLGFVKYLWRDIVHVQLKGKTDKLEILKSRLSSFDVSGLGISPLVGKTLVQYAGSLTGRDFRTIAQVAPFVIYDFVSKECLAAWTSLSKLIPLIWQPEIEDIDVFLNTLKAEIDHFLLCTAQWTTRWFNKPKFHILLHLPEHIRRFGPAILFATEAFESYNAVIRAKSVHSNRHAPSRDIARAFAQGNRIRHLLSGGFFPDVEMAKPPDTFVFDRTINSYLGHAERSPPTTGACVSDKRLPRPFAETQTALYHQTDMPSQVAGFVSMILANNDMCKLNDYVLVRDSGGWAAFVGVVKEILRDTMLPISSPPSHILIERIDATHTSPTYGMPLLGPAGGCIVSKFEDILCTANAPHNCARHNCQASGTRNVVEERESTNLTSSIVVHKGPANDRVLNIGQMRDAKHVQRFRPPTIPLPHDALAQAVTKEFRATHKSPTSSSNTGLAQRLLTQHFS